MSKKSHHNKHKIRPADPIIHRKQNKVKRKKVSLFYKVSFVFLLSLFLLLSYFLVLVSTEPRSIPFVTQKIESAIKKKFGDDASLKSSYVTFTRYGTISVEIADLRIFYSSQNGEERQEFIVPKLEGEFSLLNLFLLRFYPSKIRVINPEILVDFNNFQKIEEAVESGKSKKSLISSLVGVLVQVKSDEIPTKNFEIKNAKFLIRSEKVNTEILIKESQISAKKKKGVLQVFSKNKISFIDKKGDVDFSANCNLLNSDKLSCELILEGFTTKTISHLHQDLDSLSKIDSSINLQVSFAVEKGEMSSLFFKVDAKKGNFEFPDFFSQKIDFSDLAIKGEYNHKFGILNLSEIDADFLNYLPNKLEADSKTHFSMSLLVSDLNNQQSKKLDFYIKLQNAPNSEVEKFWPIALSGAEVRKWVISHVKNGAINNAYAKFSLTKNPSGSHLNDMISEIVFSDSDLEYDSNFPAITKIAGLASFDKNSMKISLSAGNFLNSSLSESVVAIDDFSSPITLLKISGKSQGAAADSLKHVDHKSEFATEIEKYLNGNSQSSFDIRVPLKEKITLKDTYIEVKSEVSDLKNDYLKGAVNIASKKDFGSDDFISSLNLTSAELTAKNFDVEKPSGVESGLDFTVSVTDPQKIDIKNISLWKKLASQNQSKNPKAIFGQGKIFGDLKIETSPFSISSVNLKNENFGKNNYALSYQSDKSKSIQAIFLKGKQLNLAPMLQQKNFPFSSDQNFAKSQIQLDVSSLELLRNKSIKNFSLSMACKNSFCYSGSVKGFYGKKQQLLSLVTSKTKEEKIKSEDVVLIDGQIFDVGYLAEALGISNVVSSGDAKLKLRSKILDGKQVLEGEIVISDGITIYDNPTVKRLSKNTLFSAIKDKIFSNDKTIFNSVKLEFEINGNLLNIKSLIANNYKIGITAKGFFNLKNGSHEIKGMIVPGFIINNLFGIGKIPLIGGVISGLLTGGEGGGLFGIRYEYVKKPTDKEAKFETSKVSSFVPTTIKNLFDLI